MSETVSNKKTKYKNEVKEMSFWDHLKELRWRLVRSVIAVVVIAIAAFMFKEIIFDSIILAPKNSDFITNKWFCKLGELLNTDALCFKTINFELINVSMSGQLTTHLFISFITGLIVAMPYIVWEFWQFIKPALLEKERKYTTKAVFIISFLFLLGVMFSYFILVPLSVQFLGSYQVSTQIANMITLESYISTVTSLTFATGLVFELPVVVFLLVKIGLMTAGFMKRNRRYAVIVILVLAAIITPGTDIFSQLMVSFPLYLLYEASIVVAKRVEKKRVE